MDYTITLTDTEKKAIETVTANVTEWISNATKERARRAKDKILADLMTHCIANGIALTTGDAAQVQQAYDLGVCEVCKDADLPI